MHQFLLMKRTPQLAASIPKNSSLLGTVPYGLRFERASSFASASATQYTFSMWVKYSTAPTSRYILARIESQSGDNYVEISIARNNRVSIVIGEVGRAVATFYSRIGTLPADDAWHHVCVSIDMGQAQDERRAVAYVDGVESIMSAVNPPDYGAIIGAVSASYRVYLLGTTTAATQLNGSAAYGYVIIGRALPPGVFIVGTGTAAHPQTFTAARGDGDIYCPLQDDINDAWNGSVFTLLE